MGYLAQDLTLSAGAFPHSEYTLSKKCAEKGDNSGAEAVEALTKTLLELFVEQQRA